MKIYTKKGDSGTTSLIGGTRVPKYDLRIEAYGTVDEVNAYLGLIHDQDEARDFRPLIQVIQHHMFTIGSLLAADPGNHQFKLPELKEDDVRLLELSIDKMEKELQPLKNFVLPGGHKANSLAHVARCICRRAERRVVELSDQSEVDPLIMQFLNRLSDWLFVLARYFSQITRSQEMVWINR